MIWIGGVEIQLGTVIARAHKESGLTVDEWNAIEPLQREGLLAKVVYDMRAEADKEKR